MSIYAAHIANILYENPKWLPPLRQALEAQGFEVRLHHLNNGTINPNAAPDPGLWINRISPSSHTRGNLGTVALGREALFWLEAHGRRVLNGLNAFELEVSKLRQDLILARYGIKRPRTILGRGKSNLLDAASSFEGRFITKHNQGGKGLGIQLFDSASALETYLNSDEFDPGPDGKVILQQYIEAKEPRITRVEIVGGQMILAMYSSTEGGFELCPSDVCQAEKVMAEVCPAEGAATFSQAPLSEDDPLVQQYLALCAGEGIDLAGIEFIESIDGERYTYDINGTTNYNQVLGEAVGINGMAEVAAYAAGVSGLAKRNEMRRLAG